VEPPTSEKMFAIFPHSLTFCIKMEEETHNKDLLLDWVNCHPLGFEKGTTFNCISSYLFFAVTLETY